MKSTDMEGGTIASPPHFTPALTFMAGVVFWESTARTLKKKPVFFLLSPPLGALIDEETPSSQKQQRGTLSELTWRL